jgi:hypothetical protein
VAIENLILQLSKQKEKQQEVVEPDKDKPEARLPVRRTNTKFLKIYFENLAEEEAKIAQTPTTSDSYKFRSVKLRKRIPPFLDDSQSTDTPRSSSGTTETSIFADSLTSSTSLTARDEVDLTNGTTSLTDTTTSTTTVDGSEKEKNPLA